MVFNCCWLSVVYILLKSDKYSMVYLKLHIHLSTLPKKKTKQEVAFITNHKPRYVTEVVILTLRTDK